ncbi:TPA: 3-oxoacyl-ACP reductase [bacterium]|nr:MAG: 3-oxoacyl-[acyl-carrier-protein] reductase [Candidatus Hydrogenedentes bacterium CG1_02_42_14]PIU46420.1 MAG: 3-oxoacyl-ACP reductase [Candidatus Hydrogenedentes bacterium CG07_land_8_20_14_0_80_42_17]HBW46808.1 3-oxoacyl-ACP reductase [bacterium]
MSYAELKNRTAVVTGGARGIGRSIAEELARGGADIIIVDLVEDSAKATASEIAATGVKAVGIAANVAKTEDVKRMVGEAIKLNGKIDILVNNAGITRDSLLIRMKDEDWNAVIEVNLKSVFLVTRELITHMMKARYGRIVNIASVIGLMGNVGQANYAASKAGIIGLTKSLAKEFAGRKITVNAIAPGYIQTDMTAKLTPEVIEKMKALIPLNRLGEPSDVARAVRFLSSDEASYITGQILTVDGGMVM